MLIEDHQVWFTLVASLGFSHYLLAFYYSKQQFLVLARAEQYRFALFALVLLTGLMYFSQASLPLYFGVHHALNEGYLWRSTRTKDAAQEQVLSASRTLLHFVLYAFILRDNSALNAVPDAFWACALLLCYGLLFYTLLRRFAAEAGPDWPAVIRYSRFEIVALGVAGLSLLIDITFLQLVVYHFILWTLYPLRSRLTQGPVQALNYIGVTIICFAFFLLLSPLGLFAYSLNNSMFYQQFYLWSYIHISASFALSGANPSWVVNLFRPARQSTT